MFWLSVPSEPTGPKTAPYLPLSALLLMKTCGPQTEVPTFPLSVHPVKSPVSKPPLATRFAVTGGGGADDESIVTAKGADFTLVLPAASVSVAVKLWLPTAKLLAGMFQVPLAFTEAVPMEFVPSNTCIVLFASPVPLKVRVVAVVWPSLVGAGSGENEDIFGCAGAVVSIVDGGGGDPISLAEKLLMPYSAMGLPAPPLKPKPGLPDVKVLLVICATGTPSVYMVITLPTIEADERITGLTDVV